MLPGSRGGRGFAAHVLSVMRRLAALALATGTQKSLTEAAPCMTVDRGRPWRLPSLSLSLSWVERTEKAGAGRQASSWAAALGCIRLTAAAELVQGVASVHGSDGRQKFCGFAAPGLEPTCPVYQHL
jgi:hypothetical protein